MRNRFQNPVLRPALTIAAALVLSVLAPFGGASAYTLNTLHSFCTVQNCGDGKYAAAGLLRDSSGNLYGTTADGGKYGDGLIFELVPNAKKTKYTEHILKNFCASANCTDGQWPFGDLIVDADGALYGTTALGGKHNGGIVFKLTHQSGIVKFAIIHSFCADKNCTDGWYPVAGLAYAGQQSGAPWDESSPLFGTTQDGGANDKGSAYELTSSGSSWAYKLLHSFNPSNSSSAVPGPLVVGSSGDLFGETYYGGKYGDGVLYRLAAGTWKEATLHNFCAEANCTDGSGGIGRPVLDANGNLFGVTSQGGSGTDCNAQGGCGVAFERKSTGKYKVIYNFCSRANCKDGALPAAGMVMDTAGGFLGTTEAKGTGDGGTVFQIGHATKWTEGVLYDFCSEANCMDGQAPIASVIFDKNGTVYGTTSEKGANGMGGTVFELVP